MGHCDKYEFPSLHENTQKHRRQTEVLVHELNGSQHEAATSCSVVRLDGLSCDAIMTSQSFDDATGALMSNEIGDVVVAGVSEMQHGLQ